MCQTIRFFYMIHNKLLFWLELNKQSLISGELVCVTVAVRIIGLSELLAG